jgi:hypothetical protein
VDDVARIGYATASRMTRIPTIAWPLAVIALACGAVSPTAAPQGPIDRLPRDVLDVEPPSARIRGVPGQMTIRPQACRTAPIAEVRRRIVDVAIQEWAFFGFRVLDQTEAVEDETSAEDAVREGAGSRELQQRGRRRPRLAPAEAERVAASIAGYWAVTAEGSWIVARQNADWTGPDGIGARWNAPWSAAFVSWVMCEAGLGSVSQFQRAIAHHTYIDQAIRARDGRAPQAAFAAYDIGEIEIVPGDLLCSSRRPAYRSIAERRRQSGVGARSHCDIVVSVDAAREVILAIGGNIRGTVGLKLIRAYAAGERIRPRGGDERPMFAHLKLRAAPIESRALDTSATMSARGCEIASGAPVVFATASSVAGVGARC